MNTENNRLLAEFLGYKNIANDEDKQDYLNDVIQFHTDWNWLMEVVEKIKKETNEDEFLNRLITTETRNAIVLEANLENCFRKSYLSIEAVHNACVEFIKWYNEQNK
jgi:hypothetical protein